MGPRKGSSLEVFFGLGLAPCFLSRASAAAARSARIFARSSSVMVGSTTGAGVSSFRCMFAAVGDWRGASSVVPRRWPFHHRKESVRLLISLLIEQQKHSPTTKTHLALESLHTLTAGCENLLLFGFLRAAISHGVLSLWKESPRRGFLTANIATNMRKYIVGDFHANDCQNNNEMSQWTNLVCHRFLQQ